MEVAEVLGNEGEEQLEVSTVAQTVESSCLSWSLLRLGLSQGEGK